MRLVRIVVAASVVVGCSSEKPTSPTPVASVTIQGATTVVENGSLQLTAVTTDAAGATLTDRVVTWSSSNPMQLPVDDHGLVTPFGVGSATITATSEGVAGTIDLTVTPGTIASVRVSPESLAAVADSGVRALVVVAFDAANHLLAITGRTIAFASSDTTIATVAGGAVAGQLPGVATITATVDGVEGSAHVVVRAPTLVRSTTQGLSGSFSAFGPALDGNTGYDYGFSYYTSVHALQTTPAADVQLGWGTWLKPFDPAFTGTPCPDASAQLTSAYQTIEGGVGVWTGSHAPTSTAKFRVNSTPDCYRDEIGSAAWNFYGVALAAGKIGLAQLSNRLLLPSDGVVFTPDAQQTFLGYGWIALPLIPAYTSPLGVATGDQSWTLFFTAQNFSGPVAFFTPETYSDVHAIDHSASRGLDTMPTEVHGAAIELGTTPSFTATVSDTTWRRIPRLAFPQDPADSERSILLQDLRKYAKSALWDAVAAWMNGGAAPTAMNPAGIAAPTFNRGQTVMNIGSAAAVDTTQIKASWFLNSAGGQAFGFAWPGTIEKGVLPEYFVQNPGGDWSPVPASRVPRRSWLADQTFAPAARTSLPDIDTGSGSPWTPAKWAAGPFSITLADGSTVEYVWYKFIDQPAIARLGLSAAQLASLQAFVETMHAQLGTSWVSLGPTSAGKLATIDPGQLVTPPAGLEKGFVPIVIRQH